MYLYIFLNTYSMQHLGEVKSGKNKAFISECKPVKVKQKEYFNLMCFWKYSVNPLCQEVKGETEEEKKRKRIRKDVKRKERDTAKGEKENIEKGWEGGKGNRERIERDRCEVISLTQA